MKIEEWRFISGYEGLYMVSNWGRVKSLNYNHTGKEQVLKPCKTKDRYLNVGLHKDGTQKTYFIHRLVYDTFGDSPRNGSILQVDHINNDKTDNRIENLQLLNPRENVSKASLLKEGKTSKYIGVSWDKKSSKWRSQIMINHKKISLGFFISEEEATLAYQKAKENLKI